jgi:hypothetical protein
MTMNTLEARHRVREIAQEIDDPDPHVVAGKLLVEIDPREYQDWLSILLPHFVREVYRSSRYIPKTDDEDDDKPDTSLAASGKWKGFRENDFWKSQQYEVNGKWMWLGELSAEDCGWIADAHSRLAQANEAKAERFKILQTELKRRRKSHVRDLGVEKVKEVMS